MRRGVGFFLEHGWIAVTAVLAAVAFAVATVWTIPVPNHELLELAPLLHAGKLAGFLRPDVLVAHVNGHVIVFPMLLIVLPYAAFGILPPLTAANLTYVNVLSAACSVAGFAAVLAVGRHVLKDDDRRTSGMLVSVAAAVGLSASQWELWTTSSIAFTLSMAAALWAFAIVVLRPENRFWTAAAMLLCVISAFSFGSGICVLPAIVAYLACAPGHSDRHRRLLAAWFLCAACIVVAFIALRDAGSSSSLEPLQVIKNTLRLIALPVFVFSGSHPQAGIATLLGAILCVLFGACLRVLFRKRRADAAVLLGLFAFGALNAFVIALARNNPLYSRYISLTYPSFAALLFALGACVPARSAALRGFLFATLLVVAVLCLQAAEKIDQRYRHFGRGAACLETYDVSTDACLGNIYFGQGASVQPLAAQLDAAGLLDRFAPQGASWETWPHPNAGYIDWAVQSGSLVIASGWAAVRGCPARHVVLTGGASGRILSHTRSLEPRPDLPATPGCDGRYGWLAEVPEASLGTGTLRAWAYDEDRNAFMLLGGATWKAPVP